MNWCSWCGKHLTNISCGEYARRRDIGYLAFVAVVLLLVAVKVAGG